MLLFKEMRPFTFFATISAVMAALSIGLAAPVVAEFLQTGLVTRLPTAVLSTGLMLAAFIVGGCGMVLDSIKRFRIDQKRLSYLSYRGFTASGAAPAARQPFSAGREDAPASPETGSLRAGSPSANAA